MALVVLALGGCATAPTSPAGATLLPVAVPCTAATDVPEAPARTLQLDAAQPGLAVKAYAANRSRWIGYADALSARLGSCK